MNIQKMVRGPLMLMGLGAALVLASSARAQQDMDPTYFDINPGTPKVEPKAAQHVAAASKVNTEATAPASLWSNQNTRQEADFSRLIIVDASMVLILMAGLASIVLYAMAATRRERQLQFSPANASYGPARGVTTH
jgi:hypothetical protein